MGPTVTQGRQDVPIRSGVSIAAPEVCQSIVGHDTEPQTSPDAEPAIYEVHCYTGCTVYINID